LTQLPKADFDSRDAVAGRAAHVLRPSGALARLDEVAAWLAGWQRTSSPAVHKPAVIVFVAEHGVTAEGVSAYPAEVTAEMLAALRSGVATAAVMARGLNAELRVVDVGVGRPTGNIAIADALSSERFDEAFEAGRAAVAGLEADLLVLGEMGIGNTTAAAAVCASLFGMPADDWAARSPWSRERERGWISPLHRWKCSDGSAAGNSWLSAARPSKRGSAPSRSFSTASW
jgi:nicotinate-nucleotide--dimethylbenzimidazole phosphoribosyltransferase